MQTIDVHELAKPRTRAQAEKMAFDISNEPGQYNFLKSKGRNARDIWTAKFVAYATGQPWAFATRGIRVANLAMRGAV